MRRLLCLLVAVYVNIRYIRMGIFCGYLLDGHDFEGNGEVCGDHWHVVCQRCGLVAATEIDPSRGDT